MSQYSLLFNLRSTDLPSSSTILEPAPKTENLPKLDIEKKTERDIQETIDPKPDTSDKLTHTTAVNSVTSPTMDVITIVWYFSTFIALVAFFVVMVCSDKYCTRSAAKPEEAVITSPPTPAPSYREFAPPSYDSVMKKHKSRVFIIPMLNESGELKVPSSEETSQQSRSTTVSGEDLQSSRQGSVTGAEQGSLEKQVAVQSEGSNPVVVVVNESLRQQPQQLDMNKSASDDSR